MRRLFCTQPIQMNIEMILKSFGKKNIILKDFTQRSLLKKKRKKYRQAPSEKKED